MEKTMHNPVTGCSSFPKPLTLPCVGAPAASSSDSALCEESEDRWRLANFFLTPPEIWRRAFLKAFLSFFLVLRLTSRSSNHDTFLPDKSSLVAIVFKRGSIVFLIRCAMDLLARSASAEGSRSSSPKVGGGGTWSSAEEVLFAYFFLEWYTYHAIAVPAPIPARPPAMIASSSPMEKVEDWPVTK